MGHRLSLWTGLLAALFLIQLGWWGLVIWRAADQVHDADFQRLQLAVVLAEQRLPPPEQPETRAAAWASLAAEFPELAEVPGSGVQVSAAALRRLDRTRGGQRAMVLAESSLFAILAALALGQIRRSLRRERFLALQQSNFLHAVTHELRSPLQSLRLAVETLRKRPTEERFQRYSTDMLADLDRLGTLVDNLLQTGRLEAAAFRAEAQPGDLAAAIATELERIRARRPEQAARLEFAAPAALEAQFDRATLEPILGNLIDNALKYGGTGPVRISVSQDEAEAVLAVEDSGVGLAREDLPHVFTRFWRAGDEGTRTAPGTGLGLFLVRELAQAQGARVSVASAGPGQGARFELRWPLA